MSGISFARKSVAFESRLVDGTPMTQGEIIMDNKSEKRTDNLGRMKAMDYRDMATFLCSQGWKLGDEAQCEEWLRSEYGFDGEL